MEKENKKSSTPLSIRVSEEVKDEFERIAREEEFSNKNEFTKELLSAYKLSKLKSYNGEIGKDIEDFLLHTEALKNIYMHSVQVLNGMNVSNKDNLKKENSILIQKIEQLESVNQQLMIENSVLKEMSKNEQDQIKQLISQLQMQHKAIEEISKYLEEKREEVNTLSAEKISLQRQLTLAEETLKSYRGGGQNVPQVDSFLGL